MSAKEGDYILVSAGMIFRDRKLLITQRRSKDHLGGLWEFPGGKQNADETAEQCLARELIEELAVCVEVGGLVETIWHRYPERAVCLKFFKCRWLSGEPQKLGVQDFAWITAGELKNFEFPAADAKLLTHLQNDSGLWLT